MSAFPRRLAYVLAALVAIVVWIRHNEQGAASGAERLCRAMPVGLPADQARALVARAGDIDRRIDTPTGLLAVFTGAFPFSRYTCAVEFGRAPAEQVVEPGAGPVERVTATRVTHLD